MKLTKDKPSHWYRRDGAPCHEIPCKTKEGMRAVNVKDARVLGLLPSVTNILGVLNKPSLNDWRVSQGILSALTLPRAREEFGAWEARVPVTTSRHDLLAWAYSNPPAWVEMEDAFCARVVEDMEKQSQEAMGFGSRIHEAIARELSDRDLVTMEPDLSPYLDAWWQWAKAEIEEVKAVERTVVNLDYGYAGQLDLHCVLRGIGPAVVDFKTQRVRNGKPVFYEEWPLQLAAYSFALFAADGAPSPALVSVVINSSAPGPVFCEQWPEPWGHWELFKACFELWKYQKRYNPCENRNATEAAAK